MNKLILAILLVGLSFSSQAQKFTVPQLISLSKMNSDDMDTYLTNKGYSFYKGNDEEDNETKFYELQVPKTDKTYVLSYVKYKNENKKIKGFVTYQTNYKEEYLILKQQIKTLGYVYSYSENQNENSSSLFFSKEEKSIELQTTVSETETKTYKYFAVTVYF